MSVTEDIQWVEPTQARSKRKVLMILDAAVAMAMEQGSLDLKMTEIAKRAGVAVGTLYQFFPTRTSLVAKLFAKEMEPIDRSVTETLATTGDLANLGQRIEEQMLEQLALVRTRPGLMVIWMSAGLDPAIEAADFANTQKNAAALTALMVEQLPKDTPHEDVHATALLICHLWGSVIRLCHMVGEDQARVVIRQHAAMIAAHAENLANGCC